MSLCHGCTLLEQLYIEQQLGFPATQWIGATIITGISHLVFSLFIQDFSTFTISSCLFLFWFHGVMLNTLDSKRLISYLCFVCMSVCLPVWMCITCGRVAHRGPKMALDILQTTASHRVGARPGLFFSRTQSAHSCGTRLSSTSFKLCSCVVFMHMLTSWLGLRVPFRTSPGSETPCLSLLDSLQPRAISVRQVERKKYNLNLLVLEF